MKSKNVYLGCVIVILAVALVVGCATFGPVAAGDLAGKWEGTVISDADGSQMQVEFEFMDDGTFIESIVGTPVSFGGTFVIDPVASTIDVTVTKTSNEEAVPVGANFQQDVVISRDGMTFKASGSGSSGVFRRK